ncbi:MAG: DUF115 domain-containing protein [Clostridia bacterium]|nr:MAG: DUF115 domain-containing protein [Clostridia bacterium]
MNGRLSLAQIEENRAGKGFWADNLAVLVRRFPQVAARLSAPQPAGRVQVMAARNGLPTAVVFDEAGQEFLVHSAYHPEVEAERLAGTIPYEKIFFLVVYGFGLGHHLRAILPRLNQKCRLVVVEPDLELLRAALEAVDLRDLLAAEQLFLTGGTRAEVERDLAALVHTTHLFTVSNMHFVSLPYCDRLHGDFVRATRERLFASIHSILFEIGNDVEDTLTGLRQSFANLHSIMAGPSLAGLAGVYKNRPAIVVAAGPSLQKNVDLLAEARGRALILATDAVLKLLLQKGIIFDAVLAVERGMETYDYFFRDVDIPPEIVLVGLAVLVPEIFQNYPGQKIVCFRKTELVSEWVDRVTGANSLLKVGGSVAHLGFSLARHLGADPIVLIGQDLAYSPEGYTHGVGDYLGEQVDLSRAEEYVLDYDGHPIPSTRVWKNFLTWFEQEIAQTGATCIDATEGGARIRGTEIMTLREVIGRYCAEEIPPLATVVPGAAPDRQARYARLAEEITVQQQANRRLQKKARQAVENTREMLRVLDKGGAKTPREARRFGKTLQLNDRYLIRIFNEPFLRVFMQTLVATAHFRINSLGVVDTPEKLRQSLAVQERLFAQLFDVIEIVNKELDRILQEVKRSC